MPSLTVLIVGASVAGPTAAYWFARAGANVTIIERYPKLREGGQNIDIRLTGVSVMRKMEGMEAAVRTAKAPLDGISLVRENGRVFATMKPTGDPDQQTLVSDYEIFRDSLANILFDMTKDNPRIKYHFGEQVTSIQHQDNSHDGPLTVEFKNGLPASQYDLVVACDGATSRTRALGFGCGVRDHITNLNAWAAYYSIKEDLLQGSLMGLNWVSMISVYPRSDHDAAAPFREASRQGQDALKRFVAKRYEGAGWKTDKIIEGMMASKDLYASEMVQVKVPSLHKGGFVVVGDAGYAPGPTGTGTSLALTGAYLLAGEVCKHKGDLAAGLKGYEERMQPILKDLTKIPPGVFSFMAPQTTWGLAMRNTLFSIVSSVSWLGKYFAAGFDENKYGLPDHEWVI